MVWRRLIISLILGQCVLVRTQPVLEESQRNARGTGAYDFVECCPCPKSGSLDQAQDLLDDTACRASIDAGSMVDSVGRSRDPDSWSSPSSNIPGQVFTNDDSRPFMRSGDFQEERRPILKPEVDLASSVLETIREATEEEYNDALARDAARNEARAREEEDPKDSASNLIIIVTPEASLDDPIHEASEVKESKYFEAPPQNFRDDSNTGASDLNKSIDKTNLKNDWSADSIMKTVRERIESVRNSLHGVPNNIQKIPEPKSSQKFDANKKLSLPNLKQLSRNVNDLEPQSSGPTLSITEKLRNIPLIKHMKNLKDVELIPPKKNNDDISKIPTLKLLRGNNENTKTNTLNSFHFPTLDELLHPLSNENSKKSESLPNIKLQDPKPVKTSNENTKIIDAIPGASENTIMITNPDISSSKDPNCQVSNTIQKENIDSNSKELNDNTGNQLINSGSTEDYIDSNESNQPNDMNVVAHNFEQALEDQDASVSLSSDTEENVQKNNVDTEIGANNFEKVLDINNDEMKTAHSQKKISCDDNPNIKSNTDETRISETLKPDLREMHKNIKDRIEKLKKLPSSLLRKKPENILNSKNTDLMILKDNDKPVTLQDLQQMSDSLLDSSNKADTMPNCKETEKSEKVDLAPIESTQIHNDIKSSDNEQIPTPTACDSNLALKNTEMETGSSNAIMNIARPTFNTKPSLRRDFIVQPSFLARENDINVPLLNLPSLDLPPLYLKSLNLPSLDLPSLDLPSLDIPSFDLPTLESSSFDLPTLPSLDEIREGVRNLFDTADSPNFMQRASEGLGSSLLPSASTTDIKSVLRPIDEINFDIFQLNPAALSPRSSLKSNILQPGLNLNSFKARVPLPDLQLKPLNLQSTARNNGKVLGAAISMRPNSINSNHNKFFINRRPQPLSAIQEHLNNLPSLEEMTAAMKSRAQDILESSSSLLPPPSLGSSPLGLSEPEGLVSLRDSLRSNAEDTISNIQKTLAASVQQARERNENILGSSKFAQPENVLDTLTEARENLDDKLRALHTDFNDRLSSLHFDDARFLAESKRKSNLGTPYSNAHKRKSNNKKKTKSSKSVSISKGESKKTETMLSVPRNNKISQKNVEPTKLNIFRPTTGQKGTGNEEFNKKTRNKKTFKSSDILKQPQIQKEPNLDNRRISLTDLLAQRSNSPSKKDQTVSSKLKSDLKLASTNQKSFSRPRTQTNRNSELLKPGQLTTNLFKDIQDLSPLLARTSDLTKPSSIAKQKLKPRIDHTNLSASDFLRTALGRDSNSKSGDSTSWPGVRVPDIGLGRLRESIASKLTDSATILGSPSKLISFEPKSVKDLLGGASERAAKTALVPGPALKENVSYKCKIVCVRDDE